MYNVATFAPVVIFSVHRPKADNLRNHLTARRYLRAKGIPFREAIGMYEGVFERAFIVPMAYAEIAEFVAQRYSQDSILYLDACRNARLRFKDGSESKLGQFHSVPTRDAKRLSAWTFSNGTFYACKAGA